MAKKRRHAAPAVQRVSTVPNREAAVDHEAIEKTLESSVAYYDQLTDEVVEIPATLERTLLQHSLVALVVQNSLFVVQNVSLEQIALAVGTAVWMMRKSFVAMFLPHAALQGGSGREFTARSVIFILALGGLWFAHYRDDFTLNTVRLVAFSVVFLLDFVSIYIVRGADSRLTRGQIVLSTVEVTYLVTSLPICENYKEGGIYDEKAFVLTAATAFVHVAVLLTAKYVVVHCFEADTNNAFARTQKRGAKLLENIWQDIDHFEPEHLLLGGSKKKKTKNKSRAKAPSSSNETGVDPSLPASLSVFKEPSVQLALLTVLQMLLLLSQLLLTTFVLYSWETTR
ncbi:hypothetical protein V7S43_006165 [Phytophthora oleae]|uniref:TRP C-terminal domain-containing protein n=1 Tax=Phytophthora oleae TaxID=2107226 RepID=A0ABD3FQ40_9STRA